jgi:hypothetical protein
MRYNDRLQLRRGISIQAEGKKLLEKHAIAPSVCKALLDIALGGTEAVLIFFRNSDEEPQSLIHGGCVWEGISHIRFQPDYIAEMHPSGTKLPNTKT